MSVYSRTNKRKIKPVSTIFKLFIPGICKSLEHSLSLFGYKDEVCASKRV